MSTEKVWERIASDPENRIFRTLDSSWFIDNGVKIERFDKDGSVRIMNTMTASDFYEPITSEQSLFFNNIGWEAGCLKVNIDVCDRKLGIIDMSEKIAKKIKGRFLICIWLTILFVALKVTGVIAWSWLWVLSPFLINECLSILMFLIGITLIKIASVLPDGK